MRYSREDDMGAILVVDDERDNRELIAKLLRKAGLVVNTAPNGREALKMILDHTPDIIILDVMMPEMSGVELLQILRSYLRWNSLPVILLTAYPNGPHIARAQELGLACMFEKSLFHIDDLLACVKKLLVDPTASCAS